MPQFSKTMRMGVLPALSPVGTGRQALVPASAYPPALWELLREADLGEETAFLAWQFAQLAPDLSEDAKARLMLMVGKLFVAEAQGSTYLPMAPEESIFLQTIPELCGLPGQRTPLILDHGSLYSHRLYTIEVRIADAVATRLATPTRFAPETIRQALDDLERAGGQVPSGEQQAAIVQLLRGTLGLLTGGPGTGKTTTALSLARCLVRCGVPAHRIALAAPTGKAAGRMQDSFRYGLAALRAPSEADRALSDRLPAAQTLHRLLAYSPQKRRFLAGPGHPLPYDVIFVDEGSMVDVALFDALCTAIPLSVPLVVMGDAEQLPSVATGALFRDLASFAVRLRTGHRMDPNTSGGRALAEAAERIQAGDGVGFVSKCPLRNKVQGLTGEGAERLPPSFRNDLLTAHMQSHYTQGPLHAIRQRGFTLQKGAFLPEDEILLTHAFATLGRSRVLCVTQKRPTGVEAANEFLHDLMGGGPAFLPGEPVLMLRNDYERGLWNGDQGMVLRIPGPSDPEGLQVVFPTRAGFKAYPMLSLQASLVHAFALSVHKAQGSELDQVLLLLPDQPSPLLTRELFYTAVTRARTHAMICGPDERLQEAIANTIRRNSGIPNRLGFQSHAKGLQSPKSAR